MNETLSTAILAGGCFWCTEAVYTRVNGVQDVSSGYTDGFVKNPAYREVCTGKTGHTEAIKIIFDTSKVSFAELLEIFFATHDPTTLNKQGNDVGTQYRSGIYYTNQEQKEIAETVVKELQASAIFENPIVTEIKAFKEFYDAGDDHKAYYDNNKQQGYCQFIIRPKIEKLKTLFADKLKLR